MEYKHEEYDKFIQSIIDTRGQWSEEIKNMKRGYARHHILPKCLGGLPKSVNWEQHDNVIWLTAGEHFIAHKLLAKENPDNYKLVCAYKRMCYSKYLGEIVTPEDFDLANRLFSELHSKHLLGKKHKHHIIHDKEAYSLQKSIQCIGTGNPMYGKGYLVSGGKNGHATRNFYYKSKKFDCMKSLLEFLNSIGLHITKSGMMTWLKGEATDRLYRMYGDIIKDISWEYKNAN